MKLDRTEKISQSGKRDIVDPEKQWHLFRSPAKFYLLDNMATYYFNRRGSKEVQGGYSLENILRTELNYGKLKFKEITDLTDKQWHDYMLRYEPIKYFAYNIWDQLGMLFLEEKTNDISITMPTLVERSLWEDYAFSLKALLDDFHFYALENNVVLGTQVVDEHFEGSLGRDDWTVTLHPWKRVPVTEKNRIFKEALLQTNLLFATGDNDVVSSYPSSTILSYLSKASTYKELVDIENKELLDIKHYNSYLLTGKIAHTAYMRKMFNAPTYKKFMT